eukprot:3997925-Prymnesium_polylepis.1
MLLLLLLPTPASPPPLSARSLANPIPAPTTAAASWPPWVVPAAPPNTPEPPVWVAVLPRGGDGSCGLDIAGDGPSRHHCGTTSTSTTGVLADVPWVRVGNAGDASAGRSSG